MFHRSPPIRTGASDQLSPHASNFGSPNIDGRTHMNLNSYLKLMVQQLASDLFLSVGAPAGIKIEGRTQPVDGVAMTVPQIEGIARELMSEDQRAEFAGTLEMNLAHDEAGAGRFRINLYRQRGDIAIAIRYIPDRIPAIEELNLPPILKDLIMLPQGLVLIVGPSGSGKSTALASMIDYRNTKTTGHILTVEEPIEYLHTHKKSIVDQREVGLDTLSCANALKNAMRESPDVIMIGEIRDRETMQAAISYAETGHLCLSTLHSTNANQTLERIINFFPEDTRSQVLLDLSLNLRAVVSLRLLHGAASRRIPAVEVLLKTPYVSDLIAKGQVDLLRDAMKESTDNGMQSFGDALFHLYRDGKISYEEALSHADSRNDLQLRLRLSGDTSRDASATEAERMHLEPLAGAPGQIDPGAWLGTSIGSHEAANRHREARLRAQTNSSGPVRPA
jgi:twitching motility protein PilU